LAYLTSSGISKADYYNLTLAEAGGLAVLAWGVKEEQGEDDARTGG
jgi:hypothetical protein